MNNGLEIVSVRLRPEPQYEKELFAKTSFQLADIFENEMRDYPKDTLCLLCIGTNGRVLNQQIMSREDFKLKERYLLSIAVVSNASAMVLLSNGEYDEYLQDLSDSLNYDCRHIGISLLDHIFGVGTDSPKSMMIENMLDIAGRKGFFDEAAEPDLTDTDIRANAEIDLKTDRVISFDGELNESDAAAIIAEDIKLYDREVIVVMNLDEDDHVINANYVSFGSLNESLAHPREIFKPTLLSDASSLVLIHNHPSGSNEPSQSDIDMVKRIIECGNIFGIEVKESYVVAGRTGRLRKMLNNDDELFIGSSGEVLLNTKNDLMENSSHVPKKKKAKCR